MAFDKNKYLLDKPNNIGSKRKKSLTLGDSFVLNRSMSRKKSPDTRNTKRHRDNRTAEKSKVKQDEQK